LVLVAEALKLVDFSDTTSPLQVGLRII